MNTASEPPVLVIGAGGKTGRRVAERLRSLGVPVRPASRSSPAPFDWEHPDTWPAVLQGVRTAYVSYHPDLAFPGAAERIGRLAGAAAAHGVERVVLLAGRGEAGAIASEDALRAVLPRSTVLRCAFFDQNFTEGHLVESVLDGVVAVPAAPDLVEPFVDADDIADVAVAALLEGGHEGAGYDLSGPQALTFGEAADVLGAAVGRAVRFVPVTVEEWVEGAVAAGLPPGVAADYGNLFREVLDGRNVRPVDGVQRVLGREPISFAAFVRRAMTPGARAVPDGVR